MIDFCRITSIAAVLAIAMSGAMAQDAKPAAKTTPKAAAKTSKTKAAAQPAAPVTLQEAALLAASSDQMAAADRVYVGRSECELGQHITVEPNEKNAGYFDVSLGKKQWLVKPTVSSTGALRMEDVRGKALLLQIANKSMLMDTAAGNRLADNCVHPKQREAMAGQQPQGGILLQAPPSR